MAISTQIQNLNLIPGKSAPVVVHLSQGNVGNTVQFYLYDGDNPYYPPTNVSIAVHGVRADGSVFGPYAVSVTSGSNLVSFDIVTAMTSVNGAAIGELVLTDSNQNQIGSANFGMLVEATPYSSSVTYEDDLSIYQRILAYVQSISATSTDKIAAETAERKQADSALGTRIDNEAAARQNGDNNLQAQINQIVAPSGEAPSAAEVENARIDVDGVTHDTLGDAIRGQVNALKTSNDGAFITSQVRVSGTLTHISYTDKTKLPGTVGYNIGWVFDVTNASRISFHTKSKRYYNIYTFTDSSGNALTYQKEATADTAYDLDLAVPSGATSIYITTGDGSALDNVTNVILYKKTNITKVANDGFANLELKPTFTSTFCTGTSMPTSSDHIHIQSGRYDVSDESVVYVKMKSQKLYNIYTFTDANIDRDFSYYNDLEKNRSPFNTAIERVTFGSNVTRVGDRALASCRSLKDVVLPDNITTIGVEAFKWSEPQTLTLSKNLTTVEDYGFYGMVGSALPTLTLPMNMSAVGKQAYYDIPNLTGVYVPWIDPLFALANDTESEKTFSYATNQTLWIPGGTLASYQAADGWKRFQNFDYWSFVVSATVAGKGQLDVANGEAVHANGTNTAKSVTGTQLVGAGAGTPVSGLFVREKDVTFTATPARGYELSSLTANGTDVKAASKVANLLADQNIAAQFTPIIYNITYNNLLNGVVDPANPATYTVEDAAITLVNPTRTAYNFKGWTGTDLTEATMTVVIPASSIGDREYTATWEPIVYDITYDLAGGAVDPANLDKYTIETADFTLTNPTKLGYTFTGWEGTDLTEKTMAVTVTTGHWGDRSYTATWEPNPYKVRFAINGGDGTETMADQDHVYDAPLNLTQNAFTRTGYTFKEWNSKADGTGTVYADKAEVVNLTAVRDEVVTLYAQWTPNPYQVRFNANNGTGTMANQDFVYDTQQALTENAFSRRGYTFEGWNTKADGSGDSYADKASVKNLTAELNGIVDLYAQWQIIPYTVTYDLAGGSIATANPTEYNVETATFTLTNPTREGYDFAGWEGTGITGTATTVTIAKGSIENRSYTATWTPIVYDITYDLAGGSVATANPTSYTIETATFTLTNPTKAHWIFKGWTGTDLSAATTAVTIAKGSIGIRSYTATWERETYTVSISSNLTGKVTASTTSPQYEDDVVLTIADDEDYDLVSLTVDGIDVTSQISGGQYTISSVSANVAVVATYNANKAFITMAHAQQTFSCTQPLDFTGVTGLKAYIASGYIDGTVVLTCVDKVPASTGLFLVGTEGAEYKVPFAASSAFYSNLLKPVLTAQTVPSEADGCTNFLYSEVNGVKGFYKSSGSGTVAAGKAYLQLPTSALSNGVKAVGFIFEGDETGIDATEFSGRQLPNAVYDMAGRKVADTFDAKKLPQGVYIVNGKKIAIK